MTISHHVVFCLFIHSIFGMFIHIILDTPWSWNIWCYKYSNKIKATVLIILAGPLLWVTLIIEFLVNYYEKINVYKYVHKLKIWLEK